MRPGNIIALPVTAVSSTTAYNGIAISTDQVYAASAQVLSTGGVGTAKLQACNDEVTPTSAHWSDIPNATVSVTGAGIFLIPYQLIAYQWLRVVYTNSSASGNVSCLIKTNGN